MFSQPHQEPVDYLKMDIEFSEWAVLEEALQDEGTLSYIKQLGFEVRHSLYHMAGI